MALSGRVAALGHSIIGSATDQMMTLFTENLQALVTGPDPGAAGQAAESSPNALDLARGVVTDQFSSLPQLFGVIVAVAFVAYRIGPRTGGR